MLLAAAVFFASGQSNLATPDLGWIPSGDKLVHFGVFGLLATLVVRVFFDGQRRLRSALIALALVSAYGLSDEVHQSFTPGRAVEVADWVADTLGATIAVGAYCWLPIWRNAWEASIPGRRRRGRDAPAIPGASAAALDPIPRT